MAALMSFRQSVCLRRRSGQNGEGTVLRVSQELYMSQDVLRMSQVVCPQCGQLAPLTDTRKLKRLRRSIAPQLLLSHHQMDHKAVRFSTKNVESELLEVLNALLHPVRRRLRGKEPLAFQQERASAL